MYTLLPEADVPMEQAGVSASALDREAGLQHEQDRQKREKRERTALNCALVALGLSVFSLVFFLVVEGAHWWNVYTVGLSFLPPPTAFILSVIALRKAAEFRTGRQRCACLIAILLIAIYLAPVIMLCVVWYRAIRMNGT